MVLSGTNAAEYVVSGLSIATAVQTLLLKFFVRRNARCRAQLKPTTYWPSSTPGLSSANVAIPWRFVVSSDHVWPVVIVHPDGQSNCTHSCLKRGVHELDSM